MSLLKEIGRRLGPVMGPVVGRGPFSGPPESVDPGIWENGKPGDRGKPEADEAGPSEAGPSEAGPSDSRPLDPGRLDFGRLDPRLTRWGITDAIAVATQEANASNLLLDQSLLGYTRADVLAKQRQTIQKLHAEIQALGRPAATDVPLGPTTGPTTGAAAPTSPTPATPTPATQTPATQNPATPAPATQAPATSTPGSGGASPTTPVTAPGGSSGATPAGAAAATPRGSGGAAGPAGLIGAGLKILDSPVGRRIVRDVREQAEDDRRRAELDRLGIRLPDFAEADRHAAQADAIRAERRDAPQFDEHAQGNLAQQVAIALAGLLGGDATSAQRAVNADARERESIRYGNAQTRFEREEARRQERANAEDRLAATIERRGLGAYENDWRTRQEEYGRLDRRDANRRDDAWRRAEIEQRRRESDARYGASSGASGEVSAPGAAGTADAAKATAQAVEAAWARLGSAKERKAFAGLEWRVLNGFASQAEVTEYQRKTRVLGGSRLGYGWAGTRLAQDRREVAARAKGVPGAAAPGSKAPVSAEKGVDPAFDGFVETIAQRESRGRYDAVGRPGPRGDRTYGRYGVLGANVGPWTKRYVGRAMTPEEFLRDPAAQDQVARGELRRLVSAYGIDGARTAWTRGEGAVARNVVRPDQRR